MKKIPPGFYIGTPLPTDRASRFQLIPDVHITWDDDQEWKDKQADEDGIDGPIYEIVVNIWHRHSPERIGYLEAQVLNPQGHNKYSFFELCDEHSQNLCEFAQEIKHHRIRVSPFTQDGLLLFPESFEVLPQWRGQGIGATVFKFLLEEAERRFDISVCMFNPHPLQFAASLDEEQDDPETGRAYEVALKSLRRYYVKSFGAKPLRPDSHYYYIRLRGSG